MNKSEIKNLILVSTMVLLQFVVCFDYPFNISISFTVKAIIAIVIPTVLILSLVFSLRQKSKI